MPTTLENARLLLHEIEHALASGTKHWNGRGELLETPKEIVECLLREGAVTFEPAKKEN